LFINLRTTASHGLFLIEDEKQILKTLFSKNFDLRSEIVLEDNPGTNIKKGNMGDAKIISYKPNNIEISVDSRSNALLFLAENYAKGWKASIDGKNASILRANYTFRAIKIDKGKHNVKFWYDPWSFRLGIYLSIVGLIGMFFMILISKNINHLKSFFSSRNGKDR